MEHLRRISDVLREFELRSNTPHAYNYWKNGQWEHFSSREVLNNIHCIALALDGLGLKKGDTVAICGKSSPYWSFVDYAIALIGGVTVPLFHNVSEEHFLYEIKQARPRWIFVGDREDWEKVQPHRILFEGIVSLENIALDPEVPLLDELIQNGQDLCDANPQRLHEFERNVGSDDLATILYTSGSTGAPKGVELTHKNLTAIVPCELLEVIPEDKYLSILPLAHIFGKQLHLIMTAWGIPVYFLNDLKKIPEVCQQVPITLMSTVPKVLEKAYARINERIQTAPPLKKFLGTWAFKVANRPNGLVKSLLHPIADLLVYSKIRNGFGKHFRMIISGGAPLNPQLHRFYLSVGIPVVQGWGMTEVSTIAINRMSSNKIGTVGLPVGEAEFKISEEGEVLVRGPTIMRGYYMNPEATQKSIDKDGWFHTKDCGSIDAEGHIIVRGRMNDIFKSSQGEFIDPIPIEQKLTQFPLIESAMVIGEGLPYPTALLFPDKDAIQRLKTGEGVMGKSDEAFLESSGVQTEMKSFLEKVNQGLDEWQQIRDYRFILSPLSIETGELTPTMKLRRKIILDKHANTIQEMYAHKRY